MVKNNNTIIVIVLIVAAIFLLPKLDLETFSISQLTGSNIIPKNIDFVKDGVIFLSGNTLEIELLDTLNPTCAGSSLSINQEDIVIDGSGYKCSGLPASTCRGFTCGGTGFTCLNDEGNSVGCSLSECRNPVTLPNALEPGIYNVDVIIGERTSESTTCGRNYISDKANFKIGITGSGYNLVDNKCLAVTSATIEFTTLSECASNIVSVEEGYVIENNECILVNENIIYDTLVDCESSLIPEDLCPQGTSFFSQCNVCGCNPEIGGAVCTELSCPSCDGDWINGICNVLPESSCYVLSNNQCTFQQECPTDSVSYRSLVICESFIDDGDNGDSGDNGDEEGLSSTSKIALTIGGIIALIAFL